MDLLLRGEVPEIMTRVVVIPNRQCSHKHNYGLSIANALNCGLNILGTSLGVVVVFSQSKMVFHRNDFLDQFFEY